MEVEVDLAVAQRLVGTGVHDYSLAPVRVWEPEANWR
jgi:hypothetical protein